MTIVIVRYSANYFLRAFVSTAQSKMYWKAADLIKLLFGKHTNRSTPQLLLKYAVPEGIFKEKELCLYSKSVVYYMDTPNACRLVTGVSGSLAIVQFLKAVEDYHTRIVFENPLTPCPMPCKDLLDDEEEEEECELGGRSTPLPPPPPHQPPSPPSCYPPSTPKRVAFEPLPLQSSSLPSSSAGCPNPVQINFEGHFDTAPKLLEYRTDSEIYQYALLGFVMEH